MLKEHYYVYALDELVRIVRRRWTSLPLVVAHKFQFCFRWWHWRCTLSSYWVQVIIALHADDKSKWRLAAILQCCLHSYFSMSLELYMMITISASLLRRFQSIPLIFSNGIWCLYFCRFILLDVMCTTESVPMHLLQQYQAIRISCGHFMQSTMMGKNVVVVVVRYLTFFLNGCYSSPIWNRVFPLYVLVAKHSKSNCMLFCSTRYVLKSPDDETIQVKSVYLDVGGAMNELSPQSTRLQISKLQVASQHWVNTNFSGFLHHLLGLWHVIGVTRLTFIMLEYVMICVSPTFFWWCVVASLLSWKRCSIQDPGSNLLDFLIPDSWTRLHWE